VFFLIFAKPVQSLNLAAPAETALKRPGIGRIHDQSLAPEKAKTTNQRRSGMPSGTVKWFNQTKGYGFIEPEGGGKDVFVHISAVERSGLQGLNDNQKVEYELVEGRDGREMAGELKLV
jgi:CspA family cold shock protein